MQEFIVVFMSGLSLGTQYALVAVGFTLIFGILGVINFAHGGFYAIGGYLAFYCVHSLGMPFVLAAVVAVLLTAALGYLIEVVIVHRFIEDHIATLLITLGIYLMISSGLTTIFGPEPVPFSFPISGALRWERIYLPYSSIVLISVCATSITALYWLVFRTRYGIALRAMADDAAVAQAQGIPASRMFPLAFALAAGLAALTGVLVTPILSLEPHSGDAVLGTAFIVVILGGLGSISGAVVAALAVGLIEAFASVYLGGSRGALVLFLLVMVMLVLRPEGLLGTKARKA